MQSSLPITFASPAFCVFVLRVLADVTLVVASSTRMLLFRSPACLSSDRPALVQLARRIDVFTQSARCLVISSQRSLHSACATLCFAPTRRPAVEACAAPARRSADEAHGPRRSTDIARQPQAVRACARPNSFPVRTSHPTGRSQSKSVSLGRHARLSTGGRPRSVSPVSGPRFGQPEQRSNMGLDGSELTEHMLSRRRSWPRSRILRS